jgi:hypothetical protein
MHNTEKTLPELQESKKSEEARPYVSIPAFGKFFKKNGIYDGKLFHSAEKVTYTFLMDREEIVSLHFDKNRRAIFYKGHSIANIELSSEQMVHLDQFRQEIEKDPSANHFLKEYTEVLNQFLKEKLPLNQDTS